MSCQTKAARVEPLIKSLFSLSLVGNADCPCLRLRRPAEDFSRNKERLSPEKSVEDDIISGATQTVCKHFFMLIASNTRANVKLIYTTCQEKRSKPNYFSVMASLILGGSTCFCLANRRTTGNNNRKSAFDFKSFWLNCCNKSVCTEVKMRRPKSEGLPSGSAIFIRLNYNHFDGD